MNYNNKDAMQEQRILKKLEEDYALVRGEIDEKRNVSRSIVLGRIVCFMRKRHQAGKNTPLTLHQILTGTDQQYVGWSVRYWLYTTGVPDHQKITTVGGGLKFIYKPIYDIKNRLQLMSLLKKVYDQSEDGILLDHIIESLPHAEKILEENPSGFITLTRIADKKKVLFYGKKAQDMSQIDKDLEISLTYAVPIQRKETVIKSDSDGSISLPYLDQIKRTKTDKNFGSYDSDETEPFDGYQDDGLYESGGTNGSGASSKVFDESSDSNVANVTSDDSDGPIKSGVVGAASGLVGSSKVVQKLDCSIVSKNFCSKVMVCEPNVVPKDCDDFEDDEMASY